MADHLQQDPRFKELTRRISDAEAQVHKAEIELKHAHYAVYQLLMQKADFIVRNS